MNSNQRKKIIAVIFCLVQLFQTYAQTFSSDCHSDSLKILQDAKKMKNLDAVTEDLKDLQDCIFTRINIIMAA